MKWHVDKFGTEELKKEELGNSDVWVIVSIDADAIEVKDWQPGEKFKGENPIRKVRKEGARLLTLPEIIRLELRP